ncbi:hypothetical protein D3C87_1479130 [compost metagenome]
MNHEIEYVDGNTGAVVARKNALSVPVESRAVYLRGDKPIDNPDDADRSVPIVRVVKLAVDAAGEPVEMERASQVLVREYDAEGEMLRETVMVRRMGGS